MVRKPRASAGGAARRGFARSVLRRSRLDGASTRTVSTEGAGSWEPGAGSPGPFLLPAPCSLLPFSARYPPTPAATTTSPITAAARDRGLRDFAAGSGVVGALVISVGASAVARERARAGPRGLAGEATGCSGQTAV